MFFIFKAFVRTNIELLISILRVFSFNEQIGDGALCLQS